MSSQSANKPGVKSNRSTAVNGVRSSSWTQSLSAAAMMLLAEQALSKMHERGLTPEAVLRNLAVAIAPQGGQDAALVADVSQVLALPEQVQADSAEMLAVKELLAEIARDALALQEGTAGDADAARPE